MATEGFSTSNMAPAKLSDILNAQVDAADDEDKSLYQTLYRKEMAKEKKEEEAKRKAIVEGLETILKTVSTMPNANAKKDLVRRPTVQAILSSSFFPSEVRVAHKFLLGMHMELSKQASLQYIYERVKNGDLMAMNLEAVHLCMPSCIALLNLFDTNLDIDKASVIIEGLLAASSRRSAKKLLLPFLRKLLLVSIEKREAGHLAEGGMEGGGQVDTGPRKEGEEGGRGKEEVSANRAEEEGEGEDRGKEEVRRRLGERSRGRKVRGRLKRRQVRGGAGKEGGRGSRDEAGQKGGPMKGGEEGDRGSESGRGGRGGRR
ncbi:hypothetical protein CBR_g52179 [Chara braunii]|uniref:Uncharacterized protein n=1 Tax=Chara braunii TaxID=69332 RepID=A0A388M9P3_CHABU|nr:hypothetical protein CBR_g52179 [Chara braunii]|eukprot:GBG91294.1 hypothetical protein CBR_g52179 [Chara braunii]